LCPTSKPTNSTFGTYKHLEQIVHPYFDDPEKSNDEILDKIHYFMKYIINQNHIGCGKNNNEPGVNRNGVITGISDTINGMSTIDLARKNTIDANSNSSHQPEAVKLDDVWNIQEIRLLCRRKSKLREVLLSSPSDFSFLNEDCVLVYKEYPPDEVEEEEQEYLPYTETASSLWNGDTGEVYSVDDGGNDNIDFDYDCKWEHFSIEETVDIGWD